MSLERFWGELADWSQTTFGPDAERGPTGPLKHLAKEVQEALADPSDVFEYADMVFLVFDAARRAGFSFEHLESAVWRKLRINRERKWGPRTGDEPIEHVRDAA